MTRRQTWHGAYDAPAARWAVAEPTPLDPRPVQLRRGRRTPDHTVLVGEPSHWASPACTAPSTEHRGAAPAEYAVHLAGRPDLIAAARTELAGKDLGCHCQPQLPCHRDVLIDLAQPARDPYSPGGHALAITLARPWASLVVLPNTLCPTTIHRSFDTDYRGALCIIAGHRIDPAGLTAAAAAGLTADWRTTQTGWLGAAVLVDVHRAANCCQPWGHPTRRRDTPLYHWVFRHGARLARPVFGHGFLGIRAVSWGGLLRRNAATAAPEQAIGAALAATRTAAIRRGYRQLVDPAAPQQPGSPPEGTPT